MEYIHEIDDEIKENLKMMLCSPDSDTINLALGILNHTDLSNKKTKENVMSLVLDTECGLGISFGEAKLVRKDLLNKDMDYAMDEENLKDLFTFYSTKITQILTKN